MLTVFLGAGFSYLGGLPLASQLFDIFPGADTIGRAKLIERVLDSWYDWHSRTNGTPEQYLMHLERNTGKQWLDAVWYVALTVTLQTPRVSISGAKPRIYHHTLNLTTGIDAHEAFRSTIFRRTNNVSVLTTNYDILAERGLRLEPKPRLPRPGFHYGNGAQLLEGRGFPGVYRSRPLIAQGSVPLLKLHGSVSWAQINERICTFHDCRPAIRGDAAIIAPVTEKQVPSAFRSIWDQAASALSRSQTWIIVGYSFPQYDEAVNDLFRSNSLSSKRVHILNPDPAAASRAKLVLPDAKITVSHKGLPEALGSLPKILKEAT